MNSVFYFTQILSPYYLDGIVSILITSTSLASSSNDRTFFHVYKVDQKKLSTTMTDSATQKGSGPHWTRPFLNLNYTKMFVYL